MPATKMLTVTSMKNALIGLSVFSQNYLSAEGCFMTMLNEFTDYCQAVSLTAVMSRLC
jgi:hypothetical protein